MSKYFIIIVFIVCITHVTSRIANQEIDTLLNAIRSIQNNGQNNEEYFSIALPLLNSDENNVLLNNNEPLKYNGDDDISMYEPKMMFSFDTSTPNYYEDSSTTTTTIYSSYEYISSDPYYTSESYYTSSYNYNSFSSSSTYDFFDYETETSYSTATHENREKSASLLSYLITLTDYDPYTSSNSYEESTAMVYDETSTYENDNFSYTYATVYPLSSTFVYIDEIYGDKSVYGDTEPINSNVDLSNTIYDTVQDAQFYISQSLLPVVDYNQITESVIPTTTVSYQHTAPTIKSYYTPSTAASYKNGYTTPSSLIKPNQNSDIKKYGSNEHYNSGYNPSATKYENKKAKQKLVSGGYPY